MSAPESFTMIFDSEDGTGPIHVLYTRPALTPNQPTGPGKYRMTMEVEVNLFPGTDACLTVWHGSEPIGTVGSTNNEKYDITAHFERMEVDS